MSTTTALRIGHTGLNVTDLDRSLAFYRDVLGFTVIAEGKEEDRRYAFLGEDGRPVLTLWQQADHGYAATGAGLHHLALEVDTVEQVRAYETALRAHGVSSPTRASWPIARRRVRGIFFHDPDGTRLEISTAHGVEGAPAPSGEAPTCGFF